ncbi:MAG TPA: MFS transporter [Chthoniobacteraceae bacterium]|jgi:MFS family permease|nr:MFS transporter [Chthoniobacteraceae bacterium]
MSAYPELIDVRGRAISRRDLLASMGVNTLAASFGNTWVAMTYGMPLVMFLQAIGASGLVIGLVNTARLLAVSALIPAALIAENLGIRKPFWSLCALSQRFAWFLLPLMALHAFPLRDWMPAAVIALVAWSEIAGNASLAPWLSWMADLIPLHISGRFWGIRQSISTAATLAGLVLAGQILDANTAGGHASAHGFAIVFTIAACFGVSDILTHFFVREPRAERIEKALAVHRRILAPLSNRGLRLLCLSLGVYNFGASMVVAFSLVYLKRDFDVTYSQLASLSIAAAIGNILTGYLFGGIMDRMGARRFGAILLAASPLPLAPWWFINHGIVAFGPFRFPQCIALLAAASVVNGAITNGIGVVQLRMAAELAPPKGRTMSMAFLWSSVGLLGALGPTVGGIIMDRFPSHPSFHICSGLPFSFYHVQMIVFTAILLAAALPLLLAIQEKPATP